MVGEYGPSAPKPGISTTNTSLYNIPTQPLAAFLGITDHRETLIIGKTEINPIA